MMARSGSQQFSELRRLGWKCVVLGASKLVPEAPHAFGELWASAAQELHGSTPPRGHGAADAALELTDALKLDAVVRPRSGGSHVA